MRVLLDEHLLLGVILVIPSLLDDDGHHLTSYILLALLAAIYLTSRISVTIRLRVTYASG